MIVKVSWAGLFGFLSLFIACQVFAQADVIEQRRKLMKGQGAAALAANRSAKQKDYATVEVKAKDLRASAQKIPDFFAKRSTKGKTKAKAEIWAKWDDFGKNAKNLGKAAGDLAAAAAAKDDAKVEAGVKAVSGACGACHKAFRAEKYSE